MTASQAVLDLSKAPSASSPAPVCRKLFEDIMARSVMLSSQVLLPAIVLHTHKARSGYVKADGTALLLAFLKSSQVD